MDFPNELVTLGIQGHANMMYSSTWHHKAAQQRGTQSSPHVPAEDPPALTPKHRVSALGRVSARERSYLYLQPQPAHQDLWPVSPGGRTSCLRVHSGSQKTTVLVWASVCIIIAAQLRQRGYIIWKMRQHQNPKLSRLNQKEM